MPDGGKGEKAEKAAKKDTGPHNERQMWWWLGYFLFGIHIVAFVMIYAVTHAPK